VSNTAEVTGVHNPEIQAIVGQLDNLARAARPLHAKGKNNRRIGGKPHPPVVPWLKQVSLSQILDPSYDPVHWSLQLHLSSSRLVLWN
jgi:hypothetical protein